MGWLPHPSEASWSGRGRGGPGVAPSPALVFPQQTVVRSLASSVFCHLWVFPFSFSLLLRGQKKMKASSDTSAVCGIIQMETM